MHKCDGGEYKQAAVELKKICSNREKCNGCPFRINLVLGFNRCVFNPFAYVGAFPRDWKVDKINVDD